MSVKKSLRLHGLRPSGLVSLHSRPAGRCLQLEKLLKISVRRRRQFRISGVFVFSANDVVPLDYRRHTHAGIAIFQAFLNADDSPQGAHKNV